MKILVTGSSGFVGKHLVKKLSKNHTIVRYDLKIHKDILNEKLLAKELKGVDLVVHLAAFISAQESWEKPKEYMENNALGTLSVIRNSMNAGVKKIILFSSAAVKAKPLTPYGVSKKCAEDIAKLYKDKVNIIVLRPENIYGPGQREACAYAVHNFIKAVLNNRPINIFGDGKQSRDFIYINDVVETVAKLINLETKSGQVISLGTGNETSILTLAKTVMKVLGKHDDIKFLDRQVEARKSVGDIKKISELGINFKKFVSLETGVKNLLKTQYKN